MTIRFTATCDACGVASQDPQLPGWIKLEIVAPFNPALGLRADACSFGCFADLLDRLHARVRPTPLEDPHHGPNA